MFGKQQKVRRCVVCRRVAPRHGMSLFRFPTNENRCNLWIEELIKRNDLQYLNYLSPRELKLKWVCEYHFEDNCFTSTYRNRLTNFAIPTLLDSIEVYENQTSFNPCPSAQEENNAETETQMCNTPPSPPKVKPRRRKIKNLMVTVSNLKRRLNSRTDHSYPIMTISKKISKMDEDSSFHSQTEQETENPINAENTSDITQVEILSEKDNQNDETNKAERNQSVTDAEVMLLMKQQQQLIKQQGQMLQVLQELKDIQKEILGLKRKNHELKLTKLRIAAQQAGIKVITKANK
ncbi:uncharacterized protein [Centruroides vittatus]|uniref:uncharacterized protein isoform X1 n=1 Tax=Centruroides vittatus TaxID=120091 RepID=UPI0035108EF4